MQRLTNAIERAEARVDRILTAIEAGDVPATRRALTELELAQPFDLVALGQAAVADSLEREGLADDEL